MGARAEKTQAQIERDYDEALQDLFVACARLNMRGQLPTQLQGVFKVAEDAACALDAAFGEAWARDLPA